jgi:hypothetical protein
MRCRLKPAFESMRPCIVMMMSRMPRAQYVLPRPMPVVFIFALAIAVHFSAAAAPPSTPRPLPASGISSDIRASAERDVTQWIPWFDLGVEALSSSSALVASRAFLLSARLSGNPAAWSNAGFAVTKMKDGPHPHMLHYFAAAYRGSRDVAAAVFLAQAMIMLGMHGRALAFTTLFLTRRCGPSASNCVWRNGRPKLVLHSGSTVEADHTMCGAPYFTTYNL